MNSKSFLYLAGFAMMQAAQNNVFGVPKYREKNGNTLADGKPVVQQPKQLHEFRIKGHTIMAYSRKDAIKRLSAKGMIQNKKSKKK